MTVYAQPGTEGAIVEFKSRYDNYIGGQWVPRSRAATSRTPSPVTGKIFCEVARSTAEDIDNALGAAHAATLAWGRRARCDPPPNR